MWERGGHVACTCCGDLPTAPPFVPSPLCATLFCFSSNRKEVKVAGIQQEHIQKGSQKASLYLFSHCPEKPAQWPTSIVSVAILSLFRVMPGDSRKRQQHNHFFGWPTECYWCELVTHTHTHTQLNMKLLIFDIPMQTVSITFVKIKRSKIKDTGDF